jgi:membrane-associated phospholipid phosphatase
MKRAGVQTWAIWFILMVAAVTASYLWLDRPIAIFVHERLKGVNAFALVTHIPDLVTPVVLVAFVAAGLLGLMDRRLARLPTVAVLAAASLAVAEAIKDQLKYAFGRTWPETWINNNPSFIRDGIYGFNPFHGGGGYASFPSGHTTAICAVMSVLWICYPRFRLLYAFCVAAVAIGLIGANFHFLSDVIAGGFLGTTTGWITVAVWETGEHRLCGVPK